jgi:hypothetical protein
VHLEDAGARHEPKGRPIVLTFEVWAILAIVLLLPVAATIAAAVAPVSTTAAGTAVVSAAAAATLAVVIVAIPSAATAPSFTFGHVTQSPYLCPGRSRVLRPAGSEKRKTGCKKLEVARLREIEARLCAVNAQLVVMPGGEPDWLT